MMDDKGRPSEGLTPERDPDRWETLVRSIAEGATPELERRRGERSVFGVLTSWQTPIFSASATLAAAAVAVLFFTLRSPQPAEAGGGGVYAAVVPATVAAWLEAEEPPTILEMLDEIQEAGR